MRFTRHAGVVLAMVASGCGNDVPRAQSLTEALRAFEAVHRHWAEEASKPPPKPPEPAWTEQDDALPDTLEGQREEILRKLRERMGVSEEAIVKLREAFGTYRSGQGNPKATKHPMTRAECRAIRAKAETFPASQVCGEKNMVALYNPSKGEAEKDAKVCIDQFEFPNIACEYPMTWVQAQQTQKICKAMGKRLCDAHEWEGGCYGELWPPEEEYAFTLDRENMSGLHNFNNKKNGWIRWAYGEKKDHKLCGTTSRKSDKCVASEWEYCGSNTFPAGAFPKCVSRLGVYDQHGNAAEHMSLPMKPEQLGSRGGIGRTEMKGSWFIFDFYEAHIDDCRWRAPDWHGSEVMHHNSHANYHLGFRCCKDVGGGGTGGAGVGGK
jgi:sulfatase modifying factor 1